MALGRELSPGPTGTTMSLSKEFPATAQLKICLLGHQGTAAGEDGGLCQSPPVLGRKSQSAY